MTLLITTVSLGTINNYSFYCLEWCAASISESELQATVSTVWSGVTASILESELQATEKTVCSGVLPVFQELNYKLQFLLSGVVCCQYFRI